MGTMGKRRQRYNKEICNLYSRLTDIVRNLKSCKFRWVEHIIRMKEDKTAFRATVRQTPVRRPVVDNITQMFGPWDLREYTGYG